MYLTDIWNITEDVSSLRLVFRHPMYICALR